MKRKDLVNFNFLPLQNLTAQAKFFPNVVWLKPVCCYPHWRKITHQSNLWDLLMSTLCISHLQSETPKPSSSRSHQQTAGFLTKGLFSYHLCLTAEEKVYILKIKILKIVPKDSFPPIFRDSLVWYGEEDWSPKWREKRCAKIYRSCLKKPHCSERKASLED